MHENVVIMERDSSVQELMVAILENERYHVSTAHTEQGVLNLFLKAHYHVRGFILGLNPGIENEIDFVRTLRSWDHTKDIPIAVLVADTEITGQIPDLTTLAKKTIRVPFNYHQFIDDVAELTERESVEKQ